MNQSEFSKQNKSDYMVSLNMHSLTVIMQINTVYKYRARKLYLSLLVCRTAYFIRYDTVH